MQIANLKKPALLHKRNLQFAMIILQFAIVFFQRRDSPLERPNLGSFPEHPDGSAP
jgi:hypothetical protein